MITNPCRRTAFTLVELLVVIAIIGVLAALMLAGVQYSRESARRMKCNNNLHQIAIGMHTHHDVRKSFPAGWYAPQGWAWGAFILPYVDQTNLYENLGVYEADVYTGVDPPDPGTPNDAVIPLYRCPSDLSISQNKYYNEYKKSNYAGVNGDWHYLEQLVEKQTGVFGLAEGVTTAQILDGTSNTFLVGERKYHAPVYRAAIWMRATNKAGTFIQGSSVAGVCGRSSWLNASKGAIFGYSSFHSGGAQFAMADGSVHFIYDSVDHDVYRMLANKSDGNNLGSFSFRP